MLVKKVLISGAAGSIGVHVLAHFLHHTDYEVICLDSYHHKGYKERIDELLKSHPDWKERITEIQHDLTCPIPDIKADICLHLGAISDVFLSIEQPVWTIQNNINSTLMMLEWARRMKPETFLYFSTDEVYGPVKKGEAHKEWDTHRPSNAYAASKAACEDICYSYWRSYDVPLVITGTMNNFGEMQSSSKFPVIIQKKVAAGEVVKIHGNEQEIGSRFYIHSRNVADALLFILKKGAYQHQQGQLDEPLRYHIVGEKALDNLEMAKLIADLMGKDLSFELVDFHKDNPAHDIHYGLEDNKLRPLWQQPISLEESLRRTIEWQCEHPEWIN